jgi:hypothetical protein
MIPEWLQWGIPFASGAAGVYAGLKVGIARLEANYVNLKARIEETKETLKAQVGETRCREYRTDCRDNIHNRLDDIFDALDKIKTEMVGVAVKVAKIERSIGEG